MNLTKAQKRDFQKKIFVWWKTNKRDLPWRHTHDPYNILVSEVMLQQTQVSRGLPKYLEFIKTFPTVRSLADASPAQILRIWKGMGYNRRALYLQKAARAIVDIYKGKFPDVEEKLIKLPGLGRYTARALLVFAFENDVAMVDTNIRQILTHFFFHDTPQPEKNIQEVADQLVPEGKSWEWHQALMDYGALALPRHPKVNAVSKSKPFTETNRYFRGRMLDLVREKPWQENRLISKMTKLYGKDRNFMKAVLLALKKDNLLVRSPHGTICLPE